MNAIVPATDFAALLRADTPLLDVRAPQEFTRGAIPGAVNIPLLDNEQRRRIGMRYREAGQQAAVALGHELVSGEVKAQRLRDWSAFIHSYPNARLYCFRGGLRSRIVQEWLREAGVDISRIAGGYKAMRRFLLTTLDDTPSRHELILIAGKTGCAKTHLLQQMPAHVDLEKRANHRGSAFGPLRGGQPSQIDFENAVALDFLKLAGGGRRRVFIEDESRAIGSLAVPSVLYRGMREAPLAVIEDTLENRVSTILHDYIISNFEDMQDQNPDRARQDFTAYLTGSLNKIQRRLGSERHGAIKGLMVQALEESRRGKAEELHRAWIERLLVGYYDPMYEYQLNRKLSRIVFRGNRHEFLNWAGTLNKDNRH